MESRQARRRGLSPALPRGARYIVAGSPTGAWAGRVNHIAA
ncbi:MAG: DUF2793 domain-containing protein [Betaproteobacteria bacterium]|nr:DUF2793 domain-containing protein [Betaproteobacteria bacterium]